MSGQMKILNISALAAQNLQVTERLGNHSWDIFTTPRNFCLNHSTGLLIIDDMFEFHW